MSENILYTKDHLKKNYIHIQYIKMRKNFFNRNALFLNDSLIATLEEIACLLQVLLVYVGQHVQDVALHRVAGLSSY